MKKYLKNAVAFLLFSGLSMTAFSEKGVENLSPELRELLRKEMAAIEQAMKNIIPAYISGDLSRVAEIADNIENSFILKQQMNKEQMHELHKKLPNEFIKKDKKFHEYAGMLEHVSRENNNELVGFYYSKLLESCVSCHTEHAGHRFPNFSGKTLEVEHHH